PFRSSRRIQPIHPRIERDVFPNREIFVEPEFLRHISDMLPDFRGILSYVHSENAPCSFSRFQEPAQCLDDRRLSRTVWPQKTKQLSLAHLEAHVVNRCE